MDKLLDAFSLYESSRLDCFSYCGVGVCCGFRYSAGCSWVYYFLKSLYVKFFTDGFVDHDARRSEAVFGGLVLDFPGACGDLDANYFDEFDLVVQCESAFRIDEGV